MAQNLELSWNDVGRRLQGSSDEKTNLFSITATAAPAILRAAGLRPGQRLLEIGCGRGDLLAFSRAHGLDALGLDLAPAMVELAKATHPDVDARVGDGMALPFANAQFAGVICSFTLGFMPDRARAISEAKRVLEPGGRYALTTWALEKPGFLSFIRDAVSRHGDGAHRPLSESNPGAAYYERMLESAGFEDVRVEALPLMIRSADRSGVLAVLHTAGMSRALVEAQRPSAQALIKRELSARMQHDGESFCMAMPAILLSATNPRR